MTGSTKKISTKKKQPRSKKKLKRARKTARGKSSPTVPGQKYLVSGSQLAEIFGVTLRTVQNWRAEKGLPATARDRYSLPAAWAWREAQVRAESTPGDSWQERLLSAQARQREAQANMAQMAERRARGELIEGAVLAGHLAEIARHFREQAEALEQAHGAAVGEELRRMIETAQGQWAALVGEGESGTEEENHRDTETQRKRG